MNLIARSSALRASRVRAGGIKDHCTQLRVRTLRPNRQPDTLGMLRMDVERRTAR